ncbi:MAG TPA: HK97 gp10 family phage protein [Acidobacteria bacterium]|nr:HK97 gp10 family phage protein [Acidobacteriota bacterium]
MSVTIELDWSELETALKGLERRAGVQAQRRAMRSAAQIIRTEARHLVPVRTGSLRDSIKVRTSTRRGWVNAWVVAGKPHAHLVEFGTHPHTEKISRGRFKFKRRIRHPGAKPHPFLRPAFDRKADDAIRKVASMLKDSIERSQ